MIKEFGDRSRVTGLARRLSGGFNGFQGKENPMKLTKIVIVMFFLFLIGMGFFTRVLIEQEKKHNVQNILSKGNYLVSLITLYPETNFEAERGDFFLRTLTEYISHEGLVYFFIHDRTGHNLISFAPNEIASKIPDAIQMKSKNTLGLTSQTFNAGESGDRIYEFAKPVFKRGEKTGTVRLGLKLPHVSIFSLERISLLAIFAFFIVATLSFGYYGITFIFKSLININQDLRDACAGPTQSAGPVTKSVRIAPLIEDFEHSLVQFKGRLTRIEEDKVELASKLGVTNFEKNQIINILDSISFGIIITDIQDNVLHSNDYMLNLLNKKRENALDRPLSEVLEHDEILSFMAQQESMGQTKTVSHIETTFPELAPGEIFQVSSSYLSDGGEGVIGKAIVAKNITMEKTAEKAKHDFIAHVAHELRAPLTTIKSYNEMLMGGEIDDDEMKKEFYNTISDETDRLARLIENLLNISKMEMGALELKAGLTKTDWLCKDCLAAIDAPAQKKHITIETHLPDNFPSLVGDKDLLEVAIINVLGNAVKYTPDNGTVIFSMGEQDKAIIFDISDTGYGISEEDLPNVFDKFHRSDDPNITEQTGSGLGLAITLEIIQLHGGKIEVQSEVGEGSRFIITLPKEQYYFGNQ